MATQTDGVTTLPGQEPVWNIAPGRTAALKLQSGQTGESVMAFEEVAPAGTTSTLHLHHHSDEVMSIPGRGIQFQNWRAGVGWRAGHVRFHAAWHSPCLEEHRSRSGAGALPVRTGRGRQIFEEVRRLQRPGLARTDPDVAEIFRRHGWEIIGPSPF